MPSFVLAEKGHFYRMREEENSGYQALGDMYKVFREITERSVGAAGVKNSRVAESETHCLLTDTALL